MTITILTQVDSPPEVVWAGFTRELFELLSPPFPRVSVRRFDGCRAGDHVNLTLHFPFFKQDWDGVVVDQGQENGAIYFIDIGQKLPFFLGHWRHRHEIRPSGHGGSEIADIIEFKARPAILSALLRPALWFQFWQRRPVYRKYFSAGLRKKLEIKGLWPFSPSGMHAAGTSVA